MKKVFFLVCAVCLFWAWRQNAQAQPLDNDIENRLGAEKTSLEVLPEAAHERDNGLIESTEVKYVAGPDGEWFTKDDNVYEYYVLSYDNAGRLVKRAAFSEGPDDSLMTKDDLLKESLSFEYGVDGKISREVMYKAGGEVSYTGIYEYGASGHKSKVTKYDPQNKETGYMTFVCDIHGHVIQDAEYKGPDIDKYHKFKYDNKHRAGKVMEFKGVDGGKGPDGIWLTADDVVTSAKECFYNKNGTKDKEKKYIGPGPDGQWFS
jgi:hypothetical protein